MNYTQRYATPLGGITLASDGERLTGLWFDGQKHFAEGLGAQHEEKRLPIFDQAERWLDTYFGGKDPGFTPPLRVWTTPFRAMVGKILLAIPYGRTMTYGEVAERLAARTGGGRASARAVGGAVGRNPISIIIPCHRVVGADGSLTGYAGGIERKIQLLKLEGADVTGLFTPGREGARHR